MNPLNEKPLTIPDLRSIYHKYGQNTRLKINIPEIWPIYKKCGQSTRNMVKIPEIWSTYQKLVNIPEI